MSSAPDSPPSARIPLKLPLAEMLQFGKTMKQSGVMASRSQISFEFRSGNVTVSYDDGGTVMRYEGTYQGILRMAASSFKQFISTYHRTDKNRPWIHAGIDVPAGYFYLEHTRCKVKITPQNT